MAELQCDTFPNIGSPVGTPEIGTDWQALVGATIEDGGYASVADLSDTIVVSGGFVLTTVGGEDHIFLEPGTESVSPDFWMEYARTYDPATSGDYAYLLIRAFDSVAVPGDINGIEIDLYADGTLGVYEDLEAAVTNIDDPGNFTVAYALPLDAGVQTVVWRVEAEGNEIRIYRNNVLVWSYHYGDAAFDGRTRAVFIPYFSDNDGANYTSPVAKLCVGSLPYGLSAFWQSFVGTQEILA